MFVFTVFRSLTRLLQDSSAQTTHEEFCDIYNNLMYHDCFFCPADYDDYMAAQERVNEAYKVKTHSKAIFEIKMS
jgi:glucan phosphorylase